MFISIIEFIIYSYSFVHNISIKKSTKNNADYANNNNSHNPFTGCQP